MRPENYWSIKHSVLPFSAVPRTYYSRTGSIFQPGLAGGLAVDVDLDHAQPDRVESRVQRAGRLELEEKMPFWHKF